MWRVLYSVVRKRIRKRLRGSPVGHEIVTFFGHRKREQFRPTRLNSLDERYFVFTIFALRVDENVYYSFTVDRILKR